MFDTDGPQYSSEEKVIGNIIYSVRFKYIYGDYDNVYAKIRDVYNCQRHFPPQRKHVYYRKDNPTSYTTKRSHTS